MRRREFLRWGLGGVLLSRAGMVPGRARVPDLSTIDLSATGLTAEQWRVMAAVQEHLFPSEPGVPGAREANATAWLQWVLSDPALAEESRRLYRQGVEKLTRLTLAKGAVPFHRLHEAERERLLRACERQGGAHWLREVIHYILEALLSDPVYGGNPDGVGWRWLEHRPGFRRPGSRQRYFLLGDR